MSDLSKLARQPKKEKVRGYDITIMPLGVSDMSLFEQEGKTTKESITTMKEVIKKSVPDATNEEIDNMSIEYLIDLQEIIMKVNNIDEEKIKEKTEALKDIKKEQDAKSP